MFSKMFLSTYLCGKVEGVARAFAAHDDGSFEKRGEWFKKVLKDFHSKGEVKQVHAYGETRHDVVFLCHSDQVNGFEGVPIELEFEGFDCD